MGTGIKITFDDVEVFARKHFGEEETDAISSCRGITYDDAFRHVMAIKDSTGLETLDGRNEVLFWFVWFVQEEAIKAQRRRQRKLMPWWRRIFG